MTVWTETEVRLCAPVTDDGMINKRWCKTARVAIADVCRGEVTDWYEYDVGWEKMHDEGPHDVHHERMAAFLRDHAVNIVVVDHIGNCLRGTLTKHDIAVHPGASGYAREAVVSAAHEQLTR